MPPRKTDPPREMASPAGAPPSNGQSPMRLPPAVVTLDTVPRERVSWLWAGRLALGKLAIIDGDPGLGKSVVTLDIAARVSTGSPMPGDAPTYVPDGFSRGDAAGVLRVDGSEVVRNWLPASSRRLLAGSGVIGMGSCSNVAR